MNGVYPLVNGVKFSWGMSEMEIEKSGGGYAKKSLRKIGFGCQISLRPDGLGTLRSKCIWI